MHRRLLGLLVVLATVTMFIPASDAHQGDSSHESAVYNAAGHPVRQVGDVGCQATAQKIVAAAGRVVRATGTRLLPSGCVVDRACWSDTLLEVDLTLPHDAGDWMLTPVDMAAFSQTLAMPYLHDSNFSGVTVRARWGEKGGYHTLDYFVPAAPIPPEVPTPDMVDVQAGANRDANASPRSGSAVTSSSRQPTGALTGVVVYASAGHGWTAGGSSWALQRPVLNGMTEDYGNIDQLNYFIQFAHNAGATVVPLRPTGWQPIEIIVDNDDPGVSFTGAWSDSSGNKFFENGVTLSGVPYRFATAAPVESATARFSATIATSDFYPVYGFAIGGTNRVRQTYRIAHSGGVTDVVVDHRDVGNGWVWLGEYYFEAGADNYVEVSNASPDAGIVVADAIRLGCGVGDVIRPGPGMTSGFTRDEEAQRYWAESQLGNNAVNFSSGIWDVGGLDDLSDNIGAGARIAREMNQVPPGGVSVDRWKRVHLEFHTNAFNGLARGQLCLITNTGSTTNQSNFATILSNEVDADMLLIDNEFEHAWIDRASPTLTGSYGAISTGNNSNEFDATLVELAFHDNETDAELLRDARVRRAMARSCVQGIVRFLNTLPGSPVPLAFAPDTPQAPRIEDLGAGDVLISWDAPLADGARGDAATGYVVYQSSNGRGFGDAIELGNVTSTVVSGLAIGETRYFRVAATNAGGESMPTEVLAVRRPSSGTADVLVVNGFDRLQRELNPIQSFTQPPAYAGDSIERQQWRRSNSYDYIIEHAEALAANDIGFASASNEAVADQDVDLAAYTLAIWILGSESVDDATFDASEQARLTDFFAGGGALFVSGSNIAFDLISQSGGAAFASNELQIGFAGDDAETQQATGSAGGILSDIASVSFTLAGGAPYDVRSPDRLLEATDGVACLNYVGGLGGIAGVQFTGNTHNAVTFGFPFEAIGDASVRAMIMQRVVDFLLNAAPLPFDFDDDGDIDAADFNVFQFCYRGPDDFYVSGNLCLEFDGDDDFDVDVLDFAQMQQLFTGP